MTSISPAAAHRPPHLPWSGTSVRSSNREAANTGLGRTDDQPLKYSAEEDPAPKRQKLDLSISTAFTPAPPLYDPNLISLNTNRYSRSQDLPSLPLELIDGFFVGSERIQQLQPQSFPATHSTTPHLPQRPWKQNLLARVRADGTLKNSGLRKRDDVQVQTVPYKSEPASDAPKLFADSKHITYRGLGVIRANQK